VHVDVLVLVLVDVLERAGRSPAEKGNSFDSRKDVPLIVRT
jgi:hypothetical protein